MTARELRLTPMTDDQDLSAPVSTCDQCGGSDYLCELPDGTCRLKQLAKEYLEVNFNFEAIPVLLTGSPAREMARLFRRVEDAAWARLSVKRTMELERLEAHVAELDTEVSRLRAILPTCERGPKACDRELSILKWQRDVARAELAKLLNANRNVTDACSGEWESCWCDTCTSRRSGSDHVR